MILLIRNNLEVKIKKCRREKYIFELTFDKTIPVKHIHLIQLGYGKVGKAFEAAVNRYNTEQDLIRVEWLKMVRSRQEFVPDQVRDDNYPNHVLEECGRIVLADLTASVETTAVLLEARRMGFGLLLANKNPLVEKQGVFDELMSGPIGFSATVGAGLPVIPEIRRLLLEGHRIVRLEACLSGSMGVLGSELEQGRSFSATIHEAVSKGFTEPDPRIDLAGADVAKKLLILTRLSGFQLELSEIHRTALFPAPMAEIQLDDFMNQLCLLDPILERRVIASKKQGQVLRFIATMNQGSCQVGFQPVDQQSPLGELENDQKRILIHTDKSPEPIIITGAGSGPTDTAKDLINDLLTF